MLTVNDKWLRILLPLIPIGFVLYPHLVFGPHLSARLFVSLLTPVAVCETSRLLVYRSVSWFPGRYHKTKRALALLALGVVCVAAIFLLNVSLNRLLGAGNAKFSSAMAAQVVVNGINLRFSTLGLAFAKGLVFFPLLWAAFGAAYQSAKARFTERQRDRFEKEKLQAELQQLKGIVNPHFLFNNLNSLSALIAESPSRAEAFLDELTKVFRYLLRTNNTELATVAEELQFIRSYHHLLQTRYGEAVTLDIGVGAAAEACLLPPLTLQLLVENAVKHNRVQKEAPLRIQILGTDAPALVVRNNRRRRDNPVESTGIGLHSINTRLRLLNQPGLAIEQNEDLFVVTVPLLQPLASLRSVPASAMAYS